LGVGGQAAFFMRPFFGFPATRGNTPPFFVGAKPDLRGATNSYEAVWPTIRRPRLPKYLDSNCVYGARAIFNSNASRQRRPAGRR
jgi:hypothetical protein